MAELFWVLLITGLLFVGAEIFLPGGVLGFVGACCLLGAMAAAFAAFGAAGGAYAALGIIILVGVAIAVWIKFFPGSPIGRRMTAGVDLKDSYGTQDGLHDLIGHEGETTSDLHPGGFAVIDGKRVDVITEGNMIPRGEKVRVVDVSGNRVVVTAMAAEQQDVS